ncbi:galactose-1-phosphate uridylyltransferase [Candidatus Micrarchaeota archaeon]|nr:galactose-1-phosphate uridylyltransferase [Candidatus Micrarchaeota archaeon]
MGNAENELRKDFLLDKWVLVAANRGKRPNDFKCAPCEPQQHSSNCFFCPGNEHLTPPEISRVCDVNSVHWSARCFPNKFTATSPGFSRAYGKHEVIVETPDHNKRLSQLPLGQVKNFIQLYCERLSALKKNKRIKYVSIFKNEGEAAGASIAHTHTQLIAVDKIPPVIREEIGACKEFKRKKKKCGFCALKKLERERIFFENASFICFCPFASTFYFECTILSKRHAKSLLDFNEAELRDLAIALRAVLQKLDCLLGNPPFNYYFHTAPFSSKIDFHFHVHVCLQLAKWAGFEHSTGIIINQVPPEQAAKALKEIK